jgi:hypothetical protein
MLSCDIITAFGGPVVPLVYINVQQFPGTCALILSSTVLSDTSYSLAVVIQTWHSSGYTRAGHEHKA